MTSKSATIANLVSMPSKSDTLAPLWPIGLQELRISQPITAWPIILVNLAVDTEIMAGSSPERNGRVF